MMGEYINHDNTEVKGNYLLFTTFDYKIVRIGNARELVNFDLVDAHPTV